MTTADPGTVDMPASMAVTAATRREPIRLSFCTGAGSVTVEMTQAQALALAQELCRAASEQKKPRRAGEGVRPAGA